MVEGLKVEHSESTRTPSKSNITARSISVASLCGDGADQWREVGEGGFVA